MATFVKIPTNYTQTGEWANEQAAPSHFASYASQIYTTLSQRKGRSAKVWREALTQGAKLYNAIKGQAWGTNRTAACDTFQKVGDFVAIELDSTFVIVDLRKARIEKVIFIHARLDPDFAYGKLGDLDKARRLNEGTYKVASHTPHTYGTFNGTWSDGTKAA